MHCTPANNPEIVVISSAVDTLFQIIISCPVQGHYLFDETIDNNDLPSDVFTWLKIMFGHFNLRLPQCYFTNQGNRDHRYLFFFNSYSLTEVLNEAHVFVIFLSNILYATFCLISIIYVDIS